MNIPFPDTSPLRGFAITSIHFRSRDSSAGSKSHPLSSFTAFRLSMAMVSTFPTGMNNFVWLTQSV